MVFINRGWVPLTATTWNRPIGRQTMSTVVASPEKASTFSPVNNPASKRLLWLEEKSLLEASGIDNQGDSMVILEALRKFSNSFDEIN